MTRGHVSELDVVNAPFSGVSARGVEELITHHCPDGAGCDHRLRDKAVDGAKNLRTIDGPTRRDCQCCIDRENSDEDGEPAKHHAFDVGKELVTPIQRCL